MIGTEAVVRQWVALLEAHCQLAARNDDEWGEVLASIPQSASALVASSRGGK